MTERRKWSDIKDFIEFVADFVISPYGLITRVGIVALLFAY